MDLQSILQELARRTQQGGRRIADLFGPPQQSQDNFNISGWPTPEQTPSTQQLQDYAKQVAAEYAKRAAEGLVPTPIRAREQAMRTDPAAAARPFTSDEVKQSVPFITAAAPIVYHGSPHQFEKFDASKIGTGQGAQSYGHGLYFAENPQTAKSYVQEFSQGHPLLTVRDKAGKIVAQGDSISDELLQQIGDAERKARMNIGYGAKQGGLASGPIYMDDLKVAYEKPVGQMYRVNIPDEHVAKMLDWDKPLSEQPHILEAIKPYVGSWEKPETWTGQEAYQILSNTANKYGLTGKEAGSKLLADAGIPGIKYLDQGSRAAGTGMNGMGVAAWAAKHGVSEEEAMKGLGLTRNFVVFDPEIIKDVTRKQ